MTNNYDQFAAQGNPWGIRAKYEFDPCFKRKVANPDFRDPKRVVTPAERARMTLERKLTAIRLLAK